ncbi:MAG TPA: tRNA uridine-5-carboxymethylaminomethyl(34) synthesis enzyme MnmG [Gemmatimonadales bacterium]|nr:tRNA uridine-5-carboxymethylaminomethyl(34) synthesis enzyme MnmG [Gemmatimonadales bacterium]
MSRFDVIVIGGGHAGTEAASAAARRGARTLLLTQTLETIGQMSCNPAIGGIAKGTVVREVDALGGVMGRAADRACIQFRMLNRSKGPAVWSPRAQCDRGLYRRAVRSLLERTPRLHLAQGTVSAIEFASGRVRGVRTQDDRRWEAGAVVLTAGTFLRGRIHLGLDHSVAAGRAGDSPSVELAEYLEKQGLTIERFKTGTPPRVDGRTVDLGSLVRQDGDSDPAWFSFFERPERPRQLPCYLTWAGAAVREIIEAHLTQSALYGGVISSRGPRYCPSIEDKVVKFRGAERHQVFLEPEGLETCEMYVNGLSTSLPVQVQLQMLRAVPGLERVEMTRPGYAIEYDYFPPTQLDHTLAVRGFEGLYFAGQINGTTGYEEAAGQGILAGLNAAAHALGFPPVILRRDQAMIGVLVDDLVTRGVDEPYRLFTSRAEYRLLLRQDNALRRLLGLAESLGLLEPQDLDQAHARLEREERVRRYAEEVRVRPELANPLLEAADSGSIAEPAPLADLVRRPRVCLRDLLLATGWSGSADELGWVEIEFKYEGYLLRERESAERLARLESFELPDALPYLELGSLSYEAREKLARLRPGTLGQASRIPGVSPSDVQNLALEVLKWRRGREICFT